MCVIFDPRTRWISGGGAKILPCQIQCVLMNLVLSYDKVPDRDYLQCACTRSPRITATGLMTSVVGSKYTHSLPFKHEGVLTSINSHWSRSVSVDLVLNMCQQAS